MLAISDGCCPRMDWYYNSEKQQGSLLIQSEKVNGNCYYVLEGGEWQYGIWMCGDSWWAGKLSDKGQCKGIFYASTDSKLNVQDESLQWKSVKSGSNRDLKFNCVDVSL